MALIDEAPVGLGSDGKTVFHEYATLNLTLASPLAVIYFTSSSLGPLYIHRNIH